MSWGRRGARTHAKRTRCVSTRPLPSAGARRSAAVARPHQGLAGGQLEHGPQDLDEVFAAGAALQLEQLGPELRRVAHVQAVHGHCCCGVARDAGWLVSSRPRHRRGAPATARRGARPAPLHVRAGRSLARQPRASLSRQGITPSALFLTRILSRFSCYPSRAQRRRTPRRPPQGAARPCSASPPPLRAHHSGARTVPHLVPQRSCPFGSVGWGSS